MSDTLIANLALAIVSGMGAILIIVAFLIRINSNKKIAKCQKRTIGRVIKYKFPGSSRIVPIVQFVDNGKIYTAEKKFNGFKTVRVPMMINSDIWEDEKGYLCIKKGPIANIRALAEKMWPLGKELEVYYNADNPRINFVEHPTKDATLIIIFIISGVFLILLGIVIFMLIL